MSQNRGSAPPGHIPTGPVPGQPGEGSSGFPGHFAYDSAYLANSTMGNYDLPPRAESSINLRGQGGAPAHPGGGSAMGSPGGKPAFSNSKRTSSFLAKTRQRMGSTRKSDPDRVPVRDASAFFEGAVNGDAKVDPSLNRGARSSRLNPKRLNLGKLFSGGKGGK